jgi:hypothetical protein
MPINSNHPPTAMDAWSTISLFTSSAAAMPQGA